MEVVKVPVALGDADERRVLYGRGLGYLYGRIDHGRRAWREAAGGKRNCPEKAPRLGIPTGSNGLCNPS
jgi:hypothetical protein